MRGLERESGREKGIFGCLAVVGRWDSLENECAVDEVKARKVEGDDGMSVLSSWVDHRYWGCVSGRCT